MTLLDPALRPCSGLVLEDAFTKERELESGVGKVGIQL